MYIVSMAYKPRTRTPAHFNTISNSINHIHDDDDDGDGDDDDDYVSCVFKMSHSIMHSELQFWVHRLRK